MNNGQPQMLIFPDTLVLPFWRFQYFFNLSVVLPNHLLNILRKRNFAIEADNKKRLTE